MITESHTDLEPEQVLAAVRRWLNRFVTGMQLCPFAQRELEQQRVRMVVSDACDPEALLLALHDELEELLRTPDIETTLLIHPGVLTGFTRYNQFLDQADALLLQMGLEGEIQIASFHPDYRFAGTAADDAENYTNRSPYPMLHLLREASLERAIEAFGAAEQIPLRNIETMERLGTEQLQRLWRGCFDD